MMHTNMNRYGQDGLNRIRELEAEVERLREAIADALNALEEREFRAGSEHAQEVLAHALRSQSSDR